MSAVEQPASAAVAAPVQQEITAAAPLLPLAETSTTSLSEFWIDLCGRLDLSGMSANLAAHAELVAQDGERYLLRIESAHSTLLDGSHPARIGEALSRHFGQVIKVEFETGPLQSETPVQYRERQLREKRERAIARLEADPIVNALLARFEGSSLDWGSIEAI